MAHLAHDFQRATNLRRLHLHWRHFHKLNENQTRGLFEIFLGDNTSFVIPVPYILAVLCASRLLPCKPKAREGGETWFFGWPSLLGRYEVEVRWPSTFAQELGHTQIGEKVARPETAVTDWQGRLQKISEYSGVSEVRAHRFRDTFAVELLLAGAPIERVAILLGHTSVRVTEKHYSPWIRERQEQAEADVRRTWLRDPVSLLETKGTPEVHGKREVAN